MAIFTGTNADEFITPTIFSDSVTADPPGARPSVASDILYGEGGDDTLDAAGGDDSIEGGAGNDEITGGFGADTLVGGSGNDSYRGVDASDVLIESAGGGSDSVIVLDNWTLGAFFEHLVLGANVTAAIGNSLANIMVANEFQGTLYGLGGDDTLSSGEGDATLIGGAGDDRYSIFGIDDDTIIENAGGGRDSIEVLFINFTGDFTTYTYAMEDNIESIYVKDVPDGESYLESFVTGNSSANDMYGGHGGNTLHGMSGNDSLYGGDGSDSLDGGAGRDYLDGGDGGDWVLYTTNTTTVRVDLATGSVSFPGQPWAAETVVSIEHVQTGSGNDILIGNADDNSLYGFAGNDSIDGGGGHDNLDGGAGNDTLEAGGGHDYVSGGAGSDTLLYTANTTSVVVDLADGSVGFPDWPREFFDTVENVSTGSGADVLLGNNGVANQLRGGAGADHLTGRGGADLLIGGLGNDVFHFAAGHSTAAARDRIAAGDDAVAFQNAGPQPGDRIDVSAIDANTTADGNQAFVFGGTGKGHLWAANSGSQTLIRGNVDNDAAVEFEVAIDDGSVGANAYAALDFIL